jgi:hypothetical protein
MTHPSPFLVKSDPRPAPTNPHVPLVMRGDPRPAATNPKVPFVVRSDPRPAPTNPHVPFVVRSDRAACAAGCRERVSNHLPLRSTNPQPETTHV